MQYEFLHPWWTVITIAAVMGVMQGTCAYLVLLERKVAAWVQDRLGPNRVGPFGLLQPIADGVKLLLKEDIIPSHVDRLFFMIAPAIAVGTATFAFAVVPWGPTSTPQPPVKWAQTTAQEPENYTQEKRDAVADYNNTYQGVIAPHMDIGFLFLFAISSLAVYGIILGGWSSNDKYSLMGALRSSAQIISYEIPMGLSILGVVILTGSLNLERIIGAKVDHGWNFVYQPLAALLFLTSIFAECNRLPFDLPECEQELVGGYHTEYSAMKFALFLFGEYTHMVSTSFLFVAVFFGGWHFPGVLAISNPWAAGVVKLIVFAFKMFLVIMVYMLVRWTIPRFRFDQLMGIAWKVLIPLALVNLLVIMVVKQLAETYGWSNWVVAPVLFVLSVVLIAAAGAVTLKPKAVRMAPAGLAHGE